jgi:hypothetical protein
MTREVSRGLANANINPIDLEVHYRNKYGSQFGIRTTRSYHDNLIHGWRNRRRSVATYYVPPDPVAALTSKAADGVNDVVTKYAYVKLRSVQACEVLNDGKLYLKEYRDCMDMLQAAKNPDLHSMLQDYLYLYCADNLPDALTQKLNIDDCTTIITKINECVMQLFVQCNVFKVEDTASRSCWWIFLCGDNSGTVQSQILARQNSIVNQMLNLFDEFNAKHAPQGITATFGPDMEFLEFQITDPPPPPAVTATTDSTELAVPAADVLSVNDIAAVVGLSNEELAAIADVANFNQ